MDIISILLIVVPATLVAIMVICTTIANAQKINRLTQVIDTLAELQKTQNKT